MSPKQWEAAENAKLVPLEHPRQLTDAERSLLDFLIGPLDCEELAEQVARAQVVGRCTCGCPSVTLHSGAPPMPAEVMERLTRATGRDDALETTADETCPTAARESASDASPVASSWALPGVSVGAGERRQ